MKAHTFPFRQYPETIKNNDPLRAAAFDRYFGELGGRFNEQSVKEVLGVYVEWHRRRCWEHTQNANQISSGAAERLSRTYHDIVANGELNAFAVSAPKMHMIGINSGAIINLMWFFKALLSHSRILANIGKCSQETAWFDSLSSCDWTSALDNPFHKIIPVGSFQRGLPRDPVRLTASDFLMTFAIDFLFLHEVGHILLGHTTYIHSVAGASQISERSHVPGIPALDRQAMELQADHFALNLTTGPWLEPHATDGTVFDNQAEVLLMWVFAIGALFFLFDPQQTVSPHDWKSTHPPAALRFSAMCTSLMDAAEFLSPESYHALRVALAICTDELDLVARFFGKQAGYFADIDAQLNDLGALNDDLMGRALTLNEALRDYSVLPAVFGNIKQNWRREMRTRRT
jgi:hypothetical protein